MVFYVHNFNKDLKIKKREIIIFSFIQFLDYLLLPVILIIGLVIFTFNTLYEFVKDFLKELSYIKYHFYDIRYFKWILSGLYVDLFLRKKYYKKDENITN